MIFKQVLLKVMLILSVPLLSRCIMKNKVKFCKITIKGPVDSIDRLLDWLDNNLVGDSDE